MKTSKALALRLYLTNRSPGKGENDENFPLHLLRLHDFDLYMLYYRGR